MECTFVAGQKVVCVDNKPRRADENLRLLLKDGAIYTIREVSKRPDGIGVLLNEINSYDHRCGAVRYYFYDRFRPLVSTKTDISSFQKILEEASKKVEEKA